MSFTSDINKGVNDIKSNQIKIVKLSAIELFRRLIFNSPVGNPSLWKSPASEGYTGGSFRNNWFLSFRSPSDRKDRAASKSGGDAINELRAISSSNSSVFYFTNNLPYSEAIEYGHSTQAPQGVLRKNEKNWPKIVKQIGARVNR